MNDARFCHSCRGPGRHLAGCPATGVFGEAQSGCRARTIGTSLVEFTMTFSVLCRPNTASAQDGETWGQANSRVSERMVNRIVAFIEAGGFDDIDSPIICEDITGQVRELRLHADTEHCEHS